MSRIKNTFDKIFGIEISEGGIIPIEQCENRLLRAATTPAKVPTITVDAIKKAFRDKYTKQSKAFILSEDQYNHMKGVTELPDDTRIMFKSGKSKTLKQIRQSKLNIFKKLGS